MFRVLGIYGKSIVFDKMKKKMYVGVKKKVSDHTAVSLNEDMKSIAT